MRIPYWLNIGSILYQYSCATRDVTYFHWPLHAADRYMYFSKFDREIFDSILPVVMTS